MRIQVILNPKADLGRGAQNEAKIKALAQAHGEVDVTLTQHSGHAQELALQAAQDGYDVVVAAGGDGTVHEVVNGLYAARAQGIDVALGVIPIGSGNDFAFANGLLGDVETAVSRLFTGQPRIIDLARIEDDRGHSRVFDNNFGLGFDAVVVIETQKITRIHGFLMYLLAVLRTLVFYYDRPQVHVTFDDERVSQNILFLAMGVGPRGGGGFLLVPDAQNDDGLIDSCTVSAIGRLTMLQMIPKTFDGSHVTSQHVTMRLNERITIQSEMPMPIHVDGEMFSYPADGVQQVIVTSLPGAMKVIV
ncbi:MAG: diacylglycerol kinase family lipid kinase [Ardenticatenaceae bacterium]|nr:diacylglycerol kinase family lipid kinase [Anaerolineales bacterium]MCB8920711.1 diacylglycerol kinase family lipid kinase [Ardenticatenaceae bacterium]MCB8989670.1 diacylglycerol kinase family lipid kinase [Ardenticatenaceae bacterium]MCB9002871.1 diacylglycerol kinase family lipid kinase [Ardenticatenaceae bacterium]